MLLMACYVYHVNRLSCSIQGLVRTPENLIMQSPNFDKLVNYSIIFRQKAQTAYTTIYLCTKELIEPYTDTSI